MTNTVARAIEQVVFAVEETTKGVAVFPTAAAEMIVTAGPAELNQQPTFTPSDEMDDTLDILNRFQDQIANGQFSLPIYLRPSGTAGTPPMGKFLYESLMGLETIVGSTSVTYSQAKIKPSFTLWAKKGHTVFFARGACVESGSLSLTNKGGSMMTCAGGFMQMGWAGTDEVVGAVSSSVSVIVADAKRFTAGGVVQIGTDTNSDAGYVIDSINYATNTLTMAEAVSCDDEAVIKGFLPDLTPVGDVLENKDLTISFDGTSKVLKSLELAINSPVAWQTDEISANGYVSEYIEDRRQISVNPTALFREADLSYFYDALQNTQIAVIITISNGAGSICTINLPYTELEVPNIETSAPTISLAIAGVALGSSGEDSCSIVFT